MDARLTGQLHELTNLVNAAYSAPTSLLLAIRLDAIAKRAREIESDAIDHAREVEGSKWATIARLYGLSSPGALQRFGRRKRA